MTFLHVDFTLIHLFFFLMALKVNSRFWGKSEGSNSIVLFLVFQPPWVLTLKQKQLDSETKSSQTIWEECRITNRRFWESMRQKILRQTLIFPAQLWVSTVNCNRFKGNEKSSIHKLATLTTLQPFPKGTQAEEKSLGWD